MAASPAARCATPRASRAASYTTPRGTTQDAAEQVGDDARRTTQNVMAEYLRLPPVIYVDQGARISVIVNRDLVF